MINLQMFALKFQRFVRFEFVRVENTPFFRVKNNLAHQGRRFDVLHNSCKDSSISFKHAKNDRFTPGTASSLTFSLSAKTGFIAFYFTVEITKAAFRITGNLSTVLLKLCTHILVTYLKVLRSLTGRNFKTKIMKNFKFNFDLFNTVFMKTGTTLFSGITQGVNRI